MNSTGGWAFSHIHIKQHCLVSHTFLLIPALCMRTRNDIHEQYLSVIIQYNVLWSSSLVTFAAAGILASKLWSSTRLLAERPPNTPRSLQLCFKMDQGDHLRGPIGNGILVSSCWYPCVLKCMESPGERVLQAKLLQMFPSS